MDLDKARRRVMADYMGILGQEIWVYELTGYKDDELEIHHFDPPILCRVAPTSAHDLYHQVDRLWIDPYWNLETVEPVAELQGVSSLWTFGRSYNIDTGQVDAARVMRRMGPKDWKP